MLQMERSMIMKKMQIGVWILLMMAIVFCLTACGNRNAAGNSTSSSDYGTTAPSTGGAGESSSAAGSMGTSGTDMTGGTSGAGTVNGAGNGTGTNGTGGAMEESSGGILNDIMDDAETMMDNTGNAIKNTMEPTTTR
jgi:hypothetical protein